MKVLFVTHEGIDSSIFNSQVLIHAITLKKMGIDIDILSFNTNYKTRSNSLKNQQLLKISNPGVNIILKYGFNIFYPFAGILNSILLILFFLKNKKHYQVIHARADYSTFICLITRIFHQKKVIWDCRGDSINELEETLSKKNVFFRFIGLIYFIPMNKFQILLNTKMSDSAIFVSKPLYDLHSSCLKTIFFKIIPCPVSENLFFFDSELRIIQRRNKNLNESDQVFLYSGSLALYQSIDLQLNFYSNILKDPRNVIFFATTEVEKAKKILLNEFPERFIIINIPFDEMNNYYHIADFAILLRDDKKLNYVASPTKFGEYCLSGLPVIMNDTVFQSVQYSKEIGNYMNWTNSSFTKFSNPNRLVVSKKSFNYFARTELNKIYFSLYKNLNT